MNVQTSIVAIFSSVCVLAGCQTTEQLAASAPTRTYLSESTDVELLGGCVYRQIREKFSDATGAYLKDESTFEISTFVRGPLSTALMYHIRVSPTTNGARFDLFSKSIWGPGSRDYIDGAAESCGFGSREQ